MCGPCLTFQARRAAPAQLEGVAVGAQRLLAVGLQQLPDGAAAPLGSAQDELAVPRPHDQTVFVVQRAAELGDDESQHGPVPPPPTQPGPTPTTKDM